MRVQYSRSSQGSSKSRYDSLSIWRWSYSYSTTARRWWPSLKMDLFCMVLQLNLLCVEACIVVNKNYISFARDTFFITFYLLLVVALMVRCNSFFVSWNFVFFFVEKDVTLRGRVPALMSCHHSKRLCIVPSKCDRNAILVRPVRPRLVGGVPTRICAWNIVSRCRY